MKIIIPEDYIGIVPQLNCFSMLHEHEVLTYQENFSRTEQMAEKFANAEALVLIRERTKITEDLLFRLPNLTLISQTGKVSNHLDIAACTRYGVAVAEGIGSPIAPAELTWGVILNAARQIPQAIEGMKKGLWQTSMGTILHGKVLGIWGYGKIGKLVAKYAKAFGMHVTVWGSEQSRETAVSDGHTAAANKNAFFQDADVVSIHLRLVPSTLSIVKLEDLALMKPTAIFVNTSRAELVEKDALATALQLGRPGFAAVDVYENEPVFDSNYKLLGMSNVLCTPHLGYAERESYELYFSKAFENIIAFASGQPQNIINPEVLAAKQN